MTTEASSSTAPQEQTWGRVLLCGGTDWPNLGKKAKGETDERPDLLSPHIIRSLSNVKTTAVFSSSSSDHVVCLDVNGHAYLFGRNFPPALGPSAQGPFISEALPKHVSPATFGADPSAKFVSAVTGKNVTILIDSEGSAWSAGENKVGQCGLSINQAEIKTFTKIAGPWGASKIVSGSAGVNFSLLLSDDGRVYAFGSAENGQLGNGRTGEHIVSAGKNAFEVNWQPQLVRGALEGKKVVSVASGHSHSLALDSEGFVYAWGYGGYCRMGLQDQKDRLLPVDIPQFAQERVTARAKFISCGASCSTVIDNSNTYYIAGKFKTTGPGSGGAPYTTFKYLGDLMGLKVLKTAAGTGANFALCEAVDKEELGMTLSVGFGQGTLNGELGLGEDQPKSATQPTKLMHLAGMKVLDVAAAAHSAVFLVVPNDKYSELPRHPDVEVEEEGDLCSICSLEKVDTEGEVEGPLACDMCDKAFHIGCLSPPLLEFPSEPEWFCSDCSVPSEPERNQITAANGAAKRKGDDGGDKKGAKKQK
ncbi:regulator of chromosome condensation 1/beta-lactamase-inhibitor protein II [Mrakia frigida]|uniref:regulator of chromosome condensation 1/beta-lactamase-inhibitor protein II n=1 Tax=Mrakia frigida TaxID=29902 RepID=UPI003FCBFA07